MSKEGGAAGILEAAVRGSGSRYGQRKGGIGWIKEHAGRYGSERADLLVRIAVEQDPRPARWLAMQRQRETSGASNRGEQRGTNLCLGLFSPRFYFRGHIQILSAFPRIMYYSWPFSPDSKMDTVLSFWYELRGRVPQL